MKLNLTEHKPGCLRDHKREMNTWDQRFGIKAMLLTMPERWEMARWMPKVVNWVRWMSVWSSVEMRCKVKHAEQPLEPRQLQQAEKLNLKEGSNKKTIFNLLCPQ